MDKLLLVLVLAAGCAAGKADDPHGGDAPAPPAAEMSLLLPAQSGQDRAAAFIWVDLFGQPAETTPAMVWLLGDNPACGAPGGGFLDEYGCAYGRAVGWTARMSLVPGDKISDTTIVHEFCHLLAAVTGPEAEALGHDWYCFKGPETAGRYMLADMGL